MENVFPPADPLCPGNPRPMIPAPENSNSSNYCRCALRPGNFFHPFRSFPTAFRLCSNCAPAPLQPRSDRAPAIISINSCSFRPRLVTFTEQANTAYRHLRGRLPCAVKPIGPHRASEYALNLSGTAFGLLGVMLEGLPGNRHRLPSHTTVPQPVFNRHQIDLRPLFGTATQPTSPSVASSRGEGGLLTALRHGHPAHKPLSDIPAWRRGLLAGLRHGHPAHRYLSGIPTCRRGSCGRSSARPPRPQVPQWHPHVAKRVF